MFTDVFFTPILVNDLIDRMIRLTECGASGIMNVGGANRLSKYDFGVQLARAFGYAQHHIDPVPLDRLKLLAPRPRDMSLNSAYTERVIGTSTPTVEDGLRRLVQLGREQWPRGLGKAMGATPT
jgi:dTDP-4-dehydrorhamnose reductase